MTSGSAKGQADGAGERIAKVLARSGLCSRRQAEDWIRARRVSVNGRVLESPALTVTPKDKVLVDGKPLPERQEARVWRYHKPAGLVVTRSDPQGRPTIFDRLPQDLPRVITIGRLDLPSEGLLLLTNDGDLARHLELPSGAAWTRRYYVRVHGRPDPGKLDDLQRGLTVSGVRYGSISASLDRQQGANAWITVSLREGKNREVRRVMEHLGYPVSRLIRTAFGPFQLGNLAAGAVEEIAPKVVREQIGAGEQVAPKSKGRGRRA